MVAAGSLDTGGGNRNVEADRTDWLAHRPHQYGRRAVLRGEVARLHAHTDKKASGAGGLERGPEGEWRRRRGRPRDGFLDEKRAHVEMARRVEEHEDELRAEPENGAATFNAAAAAWLDYLEHEKRVKPSTLADYRLMLASPAQGEKPTAKRLMRAFSGKSLKEIRTADVARFLSTLDREKVSARTVNKHRQVLHAIFEYAMRADAFGLRENPVRATEKRPEGGAKPIETFDPEEVEAIARAAREGQHRPRRDENHSAASDAEWQRVNDQDAAMFVVAAFTGLRLGELLALRWGDVDFTDARLTVARAVSAGEEAPTTKSRRFRTVPISDQAATDSSARRGARTSPGAMTGCSAVPMARPWIGRRLGSGFELRRKRPGCGCGGSTICATRSGALPFAASTP